MERIAFSLDSAPGSALVSADADQLEQVFINLFQNAVDAMNGRGELKVTIRIANARSSLRRLSLRAAPPMLCRVASLMAASPFLRSRSSPATTDLLCSPYGDGLGVANGSTVGTGVMSATSSVRTLPVAST